SRRRRRRRQMRRRADERALSRARARRLDHLAHAVDRRARRVPGPDARVVLESELVLVLHAARAGALRSRRALPLPGNARLADIPDRVAQDARYPVRLRRPGRAQGPAPAGDLRDLAFSLDQAILRGRGATRLAPAPRSAERYGPAPITHQLA